MARMGPPNQELLAAGIRAPDTWVPEDERTPAERRVDELLGEAAGEGDRIWVWPCMEPQGAIFHAAPAWGTNGPGLRCPEHGGQPIPARGLEALRRLREGERGQVFEAFILDDNIDAVLSGARHAFATTRPTQAQDAERVHGPFSDPVGCRWCFDNLVHPEGHPCRRLPGAPAIALPTHEREIIEYVRQGHPLRDALNHEPIRMSAPLRPEGSGFGPGPAERTGDRHFTAWLRRLRRDICRAFGVPSTRQGEG